MCQDIIEPHLSNKLLRELSRSTKPKKALLVYAKMREKGYVIDSFSLPPLLKASTRISALSEGMELRGFASKMDFVSDPFVKTGLVAMYSACGHIEDARLMFDKRPERDIVAWNIMIDGYGLFTHSYCVNGRYNNVLPLIEEMKRSNVQPDEKIFSTVVSACARAINLEFGKAFHEFITENKVSVDYNLQCALVIMYVGCGSILAHELCNYDILCRKLAF
ncbi:putative tetratricopeptide-like helical domain superfamily [Helianthus annuus]|uniref:Tetratricopeptide-like helical domain superfamily n=2 Tax=Helianthus annuus TaxID=4232 RepID=A0A9K3NXX8_HELAN|nr:putative tetratricopeptide-like helical domain superfamily [Helianthus annuus]KAJ0776317.1 putative tetratricopeptide-like helical domain superfamily [Helianthus annuus]